MQTRTITLAGASLLFAAQSALCQNPAASQTVDAMQQRRQFEPAGGNNQTNAPELYAGETSDIGPQSVLKMNLPHWHLEAVADEEIYYTDNMFLDGQFRQSADVAVSTIQAALVAPEQKVLGGELTPRIGIQQQWFNYGLFDNAHITAVKFPDIFTGTAVSLDTFDFNAQTCFADATWTRDNWVITAGFNFQQLVDSGTYDEFYREYTPNWSIEKTFIFSPTLSLTAGYQGDFRFTTTHNPPMGLANDLNDRTDHTIFGVVNFKLCQHAILQPYYQLEFSHYTAQSRDDYLNTFGLALYMPITKNISLRTFYSYARLNTDGSLAQNYENNQGGLGLTLSVEF
jgi:hypothetical protein